MVALIFSTLALCALACLACIWFGHGLDQMGRRERVHHEDMD